MNGEEEERLQGNLEYFLELFRKELPSVTDEDLIFALMQGGMFWARAFTEKRGVPESLRATAELMTGLVDKPVTRSYTGIVMSIDLMMNSLTVRVAQELGSVEKAKAYLDEKLAQAVDEL